MRKFFRKFKYDDEDRPFLEHLEAFRKTLIRCVVSVVLCSLAAIPLSKPLLTLLRAPLESAEKEGLIRLVTSTPVEAFVQIMKAVFICGIVFSLPFLVFFISLFVLPGLKEKEKKYIGIALGTGSVLFATGVFMGYKMTMPVATQVMLHFNQFLGAEAYWSVGKWYGFILHVLIGFGLAFELPIVILLLGRLGLITSKQLRKYRRHMIVAFFVLAMLLTPPDPLTQIQMALPLYLLYECCIWILWLFDKKQKEAEESGQPTEEPEQ